MKAAEAQSASAAVGESVSGATQAPVVKQGGQDEPQQETGEVTEF